MFRTPTGQTGPDAYQFEAAQIRNAQRELDRRAQRLATAMRDEMPDDAQVRVSLATGRFPDAEAIADADEVMSMLRTVTGARDGQFLADVARALANPAHVVCAEIPA